MRDLRFKIPLTWWSSKPSKNPSFPTWGMDLNPTPVGDFYETMPVFELRIDTDKATLEQFKQERIKTYYLQGVKEGKRVISGNEWTILSAVVRPGPEIKNPETYTGRFKVGAKAKFALFVKGEDDYQLLGDVTNNEEAFDQILSTFKFPDQKISAEKAAELVRDQEEVKEWLALFSGAGETSPKTGGRAVVNLDHMSGNKYVIHVYEELPTHTATFNWYEVDSETGAVSRTFN